MDLLNLAALVGFAAGLIYLYSVVRLYKALVLSAPELVDVTGPFEPLFSRFPRVLSPTVLAQVVHLAWTKEFRGLKGSSEGHYARMVRGSLVVVLVCFGYLAFKTG